MRGKVEKEIRVFDDLGVHCGGRVNSELSNSRNDVVQV